LRPRVIGALLRRRASRHDSNQSHNLPRWRRLAIGPESTAPEERKANSSN
jgi:hypothetical protein